MYRRELNYWDLQQRGIGDVERYPVSEALASIEGQQILGSAFDELAKRQQEFIAAEERGRAIRKLSAETHAPINHLHHIDRTDRSVLGLEPPPPAPMPDPTVRGAPFTPTTFAVPRTESVPPTESISSVPVTSSTTVKYARTSRPNTVEGSLIRSGVGSARSVASQAMSMGIDDILTSGASSTASAQRDVIKRSVPLSPDVPMTQLGIPSGVAVPTTSLGNFNSARLLGIQDDWWKLRQSVQWSLQPRERRRNTLQASTLRVYLRCPKMS